MLLSCVFIASVPSLGQIYECLEHRLIDKVNTNACSSTSLKMSRCKNIVLKFCKKKEEGKVSFEMASVLSVRYHD